MVSSFPDPTPFALMVELALDTYGATSSSASSNTPKVTTVNLSMCFLGN